MENKEVFYIRVDDTNTYFGIQATSGEQTALFWRDKQMVQSLVDLLNHYDVSPLHLFNVLSDILYIKLSGWTDPSLNIPPRH